MEAKVFVDKLFEKAKSKNLGEFQISYGASSNTSITVFGQKIEDITNSESQGLNFDVKIGDHIGSFSTEDLDEGRIDEIINQAVENAKLIDDKNENFFHDGSGEYKQNLEPYKPLEKLKDLDVVDYLKKVETAAYAQSPLVNNVVEAVFGRVEYESIMKNSLGLDVSNKGEHASVSVYLSAKKGEVVKGGYERFNLSKEEHFDPELLAKKAADEAVFKLDAEDIVSQKAEVVIKGKMFKHFLGKLVDAVSSYYVQEGYSKFADKLNKVVASKVVTLIEDPFMKGGYSTRAFDSEGYPTSYKEIIKDGVLMTYLYNLKRAHKDGVKSTGNGGMQVKNAYLKPGDVSFEELLELVKDGVYIDMITGLNSGFNLVSGDFSFVGEGFMIEDGKITKALNQFTITGNFYQMLMDIKKAANDTDWGSSPIGAPSVWVFRA